MSKVKDVKVSDNNVAEPATNFNGKTNAELLEVRDTLSQQMQQYQTMILKAAGALEVLGQLVVEEEDDS